MLSVNRKEHAMAAQTDRDQQSNRTADRAQSAVGGGGGGAAVGNKAKTSLVSAGDKSYGKPGEDAMARADAARPSALASGKKTEGGGATTQSSPPKNLPTGVTPMSQPAPMGATQYYGS